MEIEENRVYKRGFLNTTTEGMAAFEYSVEGDKGSYNVNGHFSITDCNRKVTLDFSAYDKTEGENCQQKIRLLIEELTEFERILVERHTVCERMNYTREEWNAMKKAEREASSRFTESAGPK